MPGSLSPASAQAVRFGFMGSCQVNGRCPRQRLSDTPVEGEPEQPALFFPADGDRTAQPIDGHPYRLPVCKDTGNDFEGEEPRRSSRATCREMAPSFSAISAVDRALTFSHAPC